MYWNYRLILHDKEPHGDWIGLHEVYYDDDDNRAVNWTKNAVKFVCDVDEGPDGIIGSLEMALSDARNRPMLVESEMGDAE